MATDLEERPKLAAGRLFVVATPIGNLSDLTARAAQVLTTAAHVLAEDTRRARTLLRHAGSSARPVSLHAHNEASRVGKVLKWLAGGADVALISDAGTPLLSDPGERLAAAVIADGGEVVPVPGPSALLAALVASGLPCVPFTFLGFLPRKSGRREQMLDRIAAASDTTVLFESPVRLVGLLDDLAERFADARPELDAARRVAVCRELTKLHEEVVRGMPSEVALRFRETAPRGEATVVVEGRRARSRQAGPREARELAFGLLDEGLSPTAAAKELAKRTGLPRGHAYDVVRRAKAGC